jgi:hypothetical protein
VGFSSPQISKIDPVRSLKSALKKHSPSEKQIHPKLFRPKNSFRISPFSKPVEPENSLFDKSSCFHDRFANRKNSHFLMFSAVLLGFLVA